MADSGRTRAPAALFRLEFGGEHGWGHLVRSGALAAALRARGWTCRLWTGSDPGGVPAELQAPFDAVVPLDLRGGVPSPCAWLVVDHYGTTDEELAMWRRACAGRILVIDDEATRHLRSADLILNARPGLEESCYPPDVATLLGPRHALLRSGLRSPIAPSWVPPPGVTPVLVMLGGTDPAGLTDLVLEALADVDARSIAPVVVRPGGGGTEVLRRFSVAVPVGAVSAGELAGWAGVSGFAVSAAGGTLHELASLRLPFIAVVVAENQVDFAAAAQACWGMPRVHAGPDLRADLARAVRRLRANLDQARAALSGLDGRGAERVADRLTQGVG